MSVADIMLDDDFDAGLAAVAEEVEVAEVQQLVSRATWVDLRTADWCWEGPTKLDFPVQRFEGAVGAVPAKEMGR